MKESEVEWSLQEHQEHTILDLHILLSFIANLNNYLYKKKLAHVLSKTKDVMFAEIYSRIILLPFQKVAIKTHAMNFSRSLPKTALVSCFWAALKENVFSHPSQSVLLHLSWKAVKALSSLIMCTGSHACWNKSVLTFSPPQPRASWRQIEQCSLESAHNASLPPWK